MRIPLPFPRCKDCGKTYETCVHANCGGKIFIEVNTDEVYCNKCNEHWNIWESNYHCTCGATFKANEVRTALNEVLVFCKVCAKEIEEQERARKRRTEISEVSLRSFASAFFEKLGYAFGVTVGTLVETFVKFFKELQIDICNNYH